MISTPLSGPSWPSTFSLSAICGTAFGETKLTASMCRKPAATSPRRYSTFRSVGIWRGKPCQASRGHSMSLTDSIVTDVTIFRFNPVTLQRFNASTHSMPVVLVEKQTPQITLLTLNRPERRNALTVELMSELKTAIENAAADPAQRILILRGAGKAFCTGLDLQEAAVKDPHDTARAAAELFLSLAETRLVTIATVHGAAGAGGGGSMFTLRFVGAPAGAGNR